MFDRKYWLLALLGGISVAACGGGSRAERTPCTTSAECGSGYSCGADGVCTTQPGSSSQGSSCRTRQDCPGGQGCEGGFCSSGSSSGSCDTDFECNGQVCVRGQCLPCAVDSDCRLGESCRGNQCTVTDGGSPLCEEQRDCDRFGNICNTFSGRCEACENSGQCGVGRTCTNGVCRTSSTSGGGSGNDGALCDSRSDCSGGFACWIGQCTRCYSDVMCTDISDVLTGPKICNVETGQCGAAECLNANDCAPGEGCWGNGHCGECTTNATCRPGETCDGRVCSAPASNSCGSNADCPNGQVCESGSCTACAASGDCDPGFICTNGACTPHGGTGTPPAGDRSTPLGGSCNPAAPTCTDGTFCMTVGGLSKCARACVGNGKGGADDCPAGMACKDFSSGAFDGAKFCVNAGQLPQTTAGSPFTTAPGGACSASSNGCQTSFCQNGGVCARACMANRDCGSNEVCFAVIDGNNQSSGYHACVVSDTTTYAPAGAGCSDNLECDSGVCTGFCSNDGDPCDDSGDCGAGGTCQGQCADHCRTSSDCNPGSTCLPWATDRNGGNDRDWTPVCRVGTGGSAPNGTSCTSDDECASWWCVSGICTEPCGSNLDCTGALADKSCGPVTFTDAANNPVYSMSFCVY